MQQDILIIGVLFPAIPSDDGQFRQPVYGFGKPDPASS